MRPSREAFETLLLDLRCAVASCEREGWNKYDIEARDDANAALWSAYDQQEDTIRELNEALAFLLADSSLTCGCGDAVDCRFCRGREVLAKTRGAS